MAYKFHPALDNKVNPTFEISKKTVEVTPRPDSIQIRLLFIG